jgi:hypothetical protein
MSGLEPIFKIVSINFFLTNKYSDYVPPRSKLWQLFIIILFYPIRVRTEGNRRYQPQLAVLKGIYRFIWIFFIDIHMFNNSGTVYAFFL